ncbi:hypothetical protein [Pseudomonas sp.]|nr:hypothetical protein [Pseudomonas sp.]
MNSDNGTVIEAVIRLRFKVDDVHPEKLTHTVRSMGYVLEMRAE